MRSIITALVLLVSLPAFALEKTYEAVYTATIKDVPAGVKKLKVWVPIPTDRGWQKVSEVQMSSAYVWIHKTDSEFGNRYAFTTIDNPPAGDVTVRVRFKASRTAAHLDALPEKSASRSQIKRALRSDKLVALSPPVRQLAAQITNGKKEPMEQARAIYDYVVANMKGDKTRPGWGEGDCTDFLALARAREIPARFVIGFPLSGAEGTVTAHHCWAEFYVKGRGWISVDASREFFFGNIDADRVEFTIGRDLVLDPRPSQPLNHFIYPYAEADGKPVGTPAIALKFRELSRSLGAAN